MSSEIASPLAESSGQGPSGSGEMPPPPARKRYRRAELDRDAGGLWNAEEEGSQEEMEEYVGVKRVYSKSFHRCWQTTCINFHFLFPRPSSPCKQRVRSHPAASRPRGGGAAGEAEAASSHAGL